MLGLSLVSLSVDRHSLCFVLNFTWQFSINAFVVQQNTASLTSDVSSPENAINVKRTSFKRVKATSDVLFSLDS